ncbi:hypothetical protein RSOLAG22IIIB_14128 [Rhizoctonia solani]|uniref:Uncharacterized protein n=1 Tax=Rhizoctonia solani TaxID=456999 RepID=A0A0K6FUD3_9AGAM|nr:hypothetical protein RSOLAG22IIIB_14128 [Rhizoctonia solani]
MNNFFVSESGQVDGRYSLVAPMCMTEEADEATYYLAGFATPLTDGARRASRALAGYTPLYKTRSHPDLWQMQTKVIGAEVGTPYMGHVNFYGCQVPCILFPSLSKDVEYAVQNPDPKYKPFWDATIAAWAVEHAQGNVEALVPWKDVDLSKPRSWWMPKWTMRVLRYEHGLPPDHPNDPERLAMLGNCRLLKKGKKRAPQTMAEWAAIPVSKSQPGDDEAGLSDAGSINDDVERGLPTSSHWDPVSKKTTTPRGKEPHDHMDVIETELQRNREYEARVGQEQAVPGPSTAPQTRGRRRLNDDTSPQRAPSGVGTETGPESIPTTATRTSEGLGEHAAGEDTPMVDGTGPPEQTLSDVPPSGAGTDDTLPVDETAPPQITPAPVSPPNPPGRSNAQATPAIPAPPRPITGTGPPRSFAPPPPNAPTVRSGRRGGPQPSLQTLSQARVRDQDRGYTVEPQ